MGAYDPWWADRKAQLAEKAGAERAPATDGERLVAATSGNADSITSSSQGAASNTAAMSARRPSRGGSAVRRHTAKKGNRYSAVIYEGGDPDTGKERRRWYPAWPRKAGADKLVNELVKRHHDGD